MLNNFAFCLAFTLSQEGGYSDDPDDPGGATNQGITLATFNDYAGPGLTAANLQAMTDQERDQIYREGYWNTIEGDDLPLGIDLVLFDFGVNAGPDTSAKTLQTALGVTADGAIGPITLAAAQAASPLVLINELTLARINYYESLGQTEFINGWLNRTKACEVAALTMVAAL